MSFSSYRGTVGLIRPTMRPGVFEDLIRMTPEGICFIPVFNDVRRGDVDEFKSAPALYRAKAEEVAKQDIDLIFLSGAPPWMLLGPRGEQKLMRDWSRDLGVPVVTSAVNQLEAFISEVTAQSGKSISQAAAGLLITDAQAVSAGLG